MNIEEMFSKELKKELQDEFFKLKERLDNGEYGNKFKREIHSFYNKVSSIANKYYETNYSSICEYRCYSYDFCYSEAISYLGIPRIKDVMTQFEKAKYIYLPQPLVSPIKKERVYTFINGKEYECISTGKTQESIIEDHVKKLLESQDIEKKKGKY